MISPSTIAQLISIRNRQPPSPEVTFLLSLEAKDCHIAETAEWFAVKTRTVGLCRIFDHEYIVVLTNLSNPLDVAARTAHVNQQDGFGMRANFTLKVIRIHCEGIVDLD